MGDEREEYLKFLFWDIKRMIIPWVEMWNIERTHIVWEWIAFGYRHICGRAWCCSLKGSPEGRRKHETRAGRVASTGQKLMASTRRVYGGRKEEGRGQRTPPSSRSGQQKRN